MAFGLLWGTGVDMDAYWLPDRVTWGGIAIGIPLSGLVPALHQAIDWKDGLLHAATGAALGFGILWFVGVLGKILFKKDAMGFGDVKLLGAIGAFLGTSAVFFCMLQLELHWDLESSGLWVCWVRSCLKKTPWVLVM